LAPPLSDEKIDKICKAEGTKSFFDNTKSYQIFYEGPGFCAIFFKNKFVSKVMRLLVEFDMTNM